VILLVVLVVLTPAGVVEVQVKVSIKVILAPVEPVVLA
jgi:hypothetical protein